MTLSLSRLDFFAYFNKRNWGLGISVFVGLLSYEIDAHIGPFQFGVEYSRG